MKKKTWFILGLAFILIVVGGASSLFYFQGLEAEREKNTVNKEYKYDGSEELIINVNNRTSLFLETSNNDTVYMKKQSFDYNTANKDKTDWKIDKTGNTTTITINNEGKIKNFEPSLFNFGDFSNNSINLQIPEKYKKVTINGNSLDIFTNSLVLTTLNLQTKHGSINANDLIVESLTIDNTNGSTYLNETKVEKELNLTASNGGVTLDEVSFEKLNAQLTNGGIDTSSTKGDMTIVNHNGSIVINHPKGDVKANNKNGDISFQATSVNYDLDLETVHGKIEISMDEDAYSKNKVDLSTKFGGISIFNENLDSSTEYSRNTGTKTIKAVTKNGNISIDEYYDDDPEYWDE